MLNPTKTHSEDTDIPEHFATKEEADAWADEHNLKRMFVRDERVDRTRRSSSRRSIQENMAGTNAQEDDEIRR